MGELGNIDYDSLKSECEDDNELEELEEGSDEYEEKLEELANEKLIEEIDSALSGLEY